MKQDITRVDAKDADSVLGQNLQRFVTFIVGNQLFGIPNEKSQSILHLESITHIPLAPPEVEGLANIRGQISTVLRTRKRLGIDERSLDVDRGNVRVMGISIEQDGNLYILLIDRIGDIVDISTSNRDNSASAVEPRWREFTLGIYRLEHQLMVALDVDRFIEIKMW